MVSALSLNDVRFKLSDMVFEKELIHEHYNIIKPPLGQGSFPNKGSFGVVYKALHFHTNSIRAVKVIRKQSRSKEERLQTINEIENLRKLDHSNILKIYEFYKDRYKFYIVTEYCEGGELLDYLIENDLQTEYNTAIIMR